MSKQSPAGSNRRQFLKSTSAASAVGAAASLGVLKLPMVHAAERNIDTLQVALVGCGGRGTGAAADALYADNSQLKLVAMADVFEHRIESSINAITQEFLEKPEKVDVPQAQRFVGFDAYKSAMDALNPNDIVILATPLAFRWVHYEYAISKGLNVFMEKPVIADGPSAKRMLELAKKADEKGIKSAVGLMVRHCRGRQELFDRIQNGEIGDIINMRAYRMHGPVATCFSTRKPADKLELMWQIERFHSFIWASGGLFSDFYIHQIDETSWMKNAWPVKAQALGGRHYRFEPRESSGYDSGGGDSATSKTPARIAAESEPREYVDQNFDTYAVEYTYPDGSKLFFDGRTMLGCRNDMSSVVHGSKGSAIVSTSGHTPGRVRIFSGQRQHRDDVVWAYPQPEQNPYRLEWVDLVDAIIHDLPYNEVPRGVEASLVTSMGRMAAHTGQEITFEQMLNCDHEFAPGVKEMTPDGLAPVMPNAEGKYPVPQPGINTDYEYDRNA